MRNKFAVILLLSSGLLDLIESTELMKGVDVTCKSGKMTARFEDGYVRGMTKYEPEELMLLNKPNSNTTYDVICSTKKDDSGHWIVTSNLHDCVYNQKEEDGNIVYEFRAVLKIKLPPSKQVSDERPVAVIFSCLYSKLITVKSFKIGSRERDVNLEVLSNGKYDIGMKIYKDKDFSQELDQNLFQTSDRVFVELSTDLDQNVIKIDKCSMSSSPTFNDDVSTIIDGGCAMRPDSVNFLVPTDHGKVSRFSFDAAKLIGNSAMTSQYLRCHVTLCNSERQQGCFDPPICGGDNIVKREVLFSHSCSELNCEYMCARMKNRVRCVCPPGELLGLDGSTCSGVSHEEHIRNVLIKGRTILTWIVATCSVLLALFILILIMRLKKMCQKKTSWFNKADFEPIIDVKNEEISIGDENCKLT